MATGTLKPRKRRSDFRKNLPLTLLALPGIVYLFIFNYIPLYGLVLPFEDYKFSTGLFRSRWTGFKNFEFLFGTGDILVATRNTILYNAVFIVLGSFMSVLCGLLLFELSRKWCKLYQTILFIPYFISWVVVGYAFLGFLDMKSGVFNQLLVSLGREPVMWYNEPAYWPFILTFAAVWKGLGYGSVIYYAALMGVDAEQYEAARIDGAGKVRMAVSISLPNLAPLITMMVILQIGKIFYSDFGLFYNVTLNSTLLYPTTDVIDTYVYRALTTLGNVGMSAAAGFYQSMVGFVLVLATNLIVRKLNPDNSLF